MKFIFLFIHKNKCIAHQQFRCTGKQGCKVDCPVEIVLRYYPDETVHLKAKENDHGVNFTTKMKKKIPKKIWQEVIMYFHLEERGFKSVRPDDILLYLAKHHVSYFCITYSID